MTASGRLPVDRVYAGLHPLTLRVGSDDGDADGETLSLGKRPVDPHFTDGSCKFDVDIVEVRLPESFSRLDLVNPNLSRCQAVQNLTKVPG